MLVSLAAAIALGVASMSDIALLAHLAPVLGERARQRHHHLGRRAPTPAGRRPSREPRRKEHNHEKGAQLDRWPISVIAMILNGGLDSQAGPLIGAVVRASGVPRY